LSNLMNYSDRLLDVDPLQTVWQLRSACASSKLRRRKMFKGRHFDRSVILLCVRWYLAHALSLRNLEKMMAKRGLSVDHTTIHRWTVRYAPLLLERFNWRSRRWLVKYIRQIGALPDPNLLQFAS
jgi:hypothetical protein